MAGVVRESGLQRFGAVPSTAGTISRVVCARARAAGIDVAPLLAQAGLTVQQIDDRHARLESKSQIRLIELVADALQDDFLGFHLAESLDLREVGLLYYVMASSETVGDALRRGERYETMVNECISMSLREGEELVVTVRHFGVERLSDRHQIECLFTLLVRACRQLTNRRLVPNRVSFSHRRKAGSPEMNAFLGCNVVYLAASDEVAFPGIVEQMPVVTADPYLNELLIRYCEEAVAHRRADRGPLRLRVENAIAPLLPHGKARMDQICRRLGMRPRTLARRLASEKLSFAEILAELRVDLAKHYLNDEALAISEIAWLLGYQEVSTFTHAFKRWTGKTPREARAHAEAGPGKPGRKPRLPSRK
jgi:AraC-like DNA-binding protein